MVDILDFKSNGRQADLSVVGSIPTRSRHFVCSLKTVVYFYFLLYYKI